MQRWLAKVQATQHKDNSLLTATPIRVKPITKDPNGKMDYVIRQG